MFPLKLVDCTEMNYKEYQKYGYEEVFKSNYLGDYYCLTQENPNDNIVIGGNFGTEFYGYISATIKKCTNTSESNVICKTPEKINELLQDRWFEVYFLDHYIDIYDYEDPIKTFSNSVYTMVDPLSSKSL